MIKTSGFHEFLPKVHNSWGFKTGEYLNTGSKKRKSQEAKTKYFE